MEKEVSDDIRRHPNDAGHEIRDNEGKMEREEEHYLTKNNK